MNRQQMLQALRQGTASAMDIDAARRRPDLAMVDDDGGIAPWLLALVRRQTSPNAPRYVISDGAAFHVAPTGHGPLVSRVEYYDHGGARKPVHNFFGVDPAARARAVGVYERVQRFVANPAAFTDWPDVCAHESRSRGPEASPQAARLKVISSEAMGHGEAHADGQPDQAPLVRRYPAPAGPQGRH